MGITKPSIGGLKPTAITPVSGVVSPSNDNTASPNKVGSQSVVKTPKPKKMGQATDKPSVFFKAEMFKSENSKGIKHPSVENLRVFLEKQRSKKK